MAIEGDADNGLGLGQSFLDSSNLVQKLTELKTATPETVRQVMADLDTARMMLMSCIEAIRTTRPDVKAPWEK